MKTDYDVAASWWDIIGDLSCKGIDVKKESFASMTENQRKEYQSIDDYFKEHHCHDIRWYEHQSKMMPI
jgi:hypothetical protein